MASFERKFHVFRRNSRAKMPIRAHDSDAGWDVFAHLVSESGKSLTKTLHQRNVTAIPTGLVVRPPEGFYFQVCSRSGLAQRSVFVANAPGIIDPSYTGELIILLYNGSFETQYVQDGHRIAQLVLAPIIPCTMQEIDAPPTPTEEGRGDAGFGSTGL